MRKKDCERDASFALELLRNCEYATLATINPDGTPYCIPVSLVVIDGAVYFHGALEGQKVTNLAANSAVCISGVGYTKLVPEKFTTEYESAVVSGICVAVTDETEKTEMMRVFCEKYAQESMHKFERIMSRMLAVTGVFKIQVTEATGKALRYAP
jgi:Predicted flavin-nucleotide-binding protein